MKAIRIISKRPGFRRAGIAHPDSPVDHPIDRFTKEQVEQLKAEPTLVVMEVDLPDPAEEPAGAGKRAKPPAA